MGTPDPMVGLINVGSRGLVSLAELGFSGPRHFVQLLGGMKVGGRQDKSI